MRRTICRGAGAARLVASAQGNPAHPLLAGAVLQKNARWISAGRRFLARAGNAFSVTCRGPPFPPSPSAAFSSSYPSGGSCHGCRGTVCRGAYVRHHFPSSPSLIDWRRNCALGPSAAGSLNSTLGRGLADFLLVGPFQQTILDVPELEIELVVHVLHLLHLFHDRSDVAFQAEGGADHLADFGGLLRVVVLALLAFQLLYLLLHRRRVHRKPHPAAFLQFGADAVGDGTGIDVFAGLVLHFLHRDDRQVAAGHHRRAEHRAGHGLGDQLQVGGAEFVGHGLDPARVAIADLVLGAAGEDEQAAQTSGGDQANGSALHHGISPSRYRIVLVVDHLYWSISTMRKSVASCEGDS